MRKEYQKEIKESMKEKMKSMNFKLKGQSFIRIVNRQIYQEINFQGSASGENFTVNITIIPIYGINTTYFRPTIRIGIFISGEDTWYDYSHNSINEATNVIKDKVLTLMNSLTTYEKLYEEIESLIDDTHPTEKEWRNIKVALMHNIGNINLFWLCYKNKQYDKCKNALKYEKETIQSWLDRNIEVINWEQEQITSEKHIKKLEENKNKLKEIAEERISKVDELSSLLENNEIEKLTSIIDEIESKNLNSLSKFCI